MKVAKALSLACVSCGKRSPSVRPSSPAAPVLTACEALKRDHGWSFVVDFFATSTGDYSPRCSACNGGAR
jgi:hypothetical protein